jgi:FG-GAP repeat
VDIPTGMAIADLTGNGRNDLNGDGKPDLAFTAGEDGAGVVYQN